VSGLKLRIRDLEISPEEIRVTAPMVGRLRYTPSPFQGRDGRGALCCLLMPVDKNSTDPLAASPLVPWVFGEDRQSPGVQQPSRPF